MFGVCVCVSCFKKIFLSFLSSFRLTVLFVFPRAFSIFYISVSLGVVFRGKSKTKKSFNPRCPSGGSRWQVFVQSAFVRPMFFANWLLKTNFYRFHRCVGEAAISQPEQTPSKNRTFRNAWNIPPWSDVIKDGLSEPTEGIITLL